MRRVLIAITAVLLTGCGGDGGSGGGGGSIGVVPAPTPTPSATPTPTPAAVRFVSEGSGPVMGRFDSYANASLTGDSAQNVTDFDGVYTLPYGANRLPGGGFNSAGFPSAAVTTAAYTSVAFGIDRPTRVVLRNTAPPGATVISPTTSLIRLIGNQAAAKAVLQLDADGGFALTGNTDLLTYSATQNLAADPVRAGEVIAANMRALALSQVFAALEGAPGSTEPVPDRPADRTEQIAAYLRTHPGMRVFTAAGTEELLRAARPNAGAYSAESFRAAAHLVNIYAAATRQIVRNNGLAPRYLLGLQGFLWTRMLDLREGNDPAAAARILALTPADVDLAVLAFANLPAFPTSLYFPAPDFVRAAPGTTITIHPDDPGSGDGRIQRRQSYGMNDFYYDGVINFLRNPSARASAVSVPLEYLTAIEATLQIDGSIRVRILPGFTGTAAVDYVSDATGRPETARVFVIVR